MDERVILVKTHFVKPPEKLPKEANIVHSDRKDNFDFQKIW
jgi:hypothetical protein